jgi:hypothetical protein
MKHFFVNAMGTIDDETFRWIIGGVIGLFSSIGGYWLSHLTDRVDVMTAQISERNQRISVLEATVDGVNKRLDRIELKIDYLIQGNTKKGN